MLSIFPDMNSSDRLSMQMLIRSCCVVGVRSSRLSDRIDSTAYLDLLGSVRESALSVLHSDMECVRDEVEHSRTPIQMSIPGEDHH